MASNDIEVDRGTTYGMAGVYKFNGVASDITGAAIRFTAKETKWDTDADDSDALITKAGVIVDASAGTYTITLTDVDTYKDPGKYYYSVKIELATGQIYTLAKGRLVIDPNTTNRTS